MSALNQHEFLPVWMGLIRDHIEQLDCQSQMVAIGGDEANYIINLHGRVMSDFFKSLGNVARLKSRTTCLCCVRHIPEHILPCGHVLCKYCIQSFGRNEGQGVFSLDYCPLHLVESRTRWPSAARIRFKPQDAGVRVMCLDG